MHFRKTKNYTNKSNEEQLLVSSYKKNYCTKLTRWLNVQFHEHINVTEKKQSNVLSSGTVEITSRPQKTSLLQQAALLRSRFGDNGISDDGDSTRFLALSSLR